MGIAWERLPHVHRTGGDGDFGLSDAVATLAHRGFGEERAILGWTPEKLELLLEASERVRSRDLAELIQIQHSSKPKRLLDFFLGRTRRSRRPDGRAHQGGGIKLGELLAAFGAKKGFTVGKPKGPDEPKRKRVSVTEMRLKKEAELRAKAEGKASGG